MRILARGWGRDQGEKEIMDAQLVDLPNMPEAEEDHTYIMGKTYLRVTKTYSGGPDPRVLVSAGSKLNLGGKYLVRLELSRREIAELFYLTHSGDIVRMVASFIQEEERQKRHELAERMARLIKDKEARRLRLPQGQVAIASDEDDQPTNIAT
jgi:hypothetical protein